MDPEQIHELTAAYALEALDEQESEEYETHLRHCPRCREELVGLREAATLLAYVAPAADPPDALRGRILEQARAERGNVIPFPSRARTRWAPALAAATAVAAAAAIALGTWAAILHGDLSNTRSARSRDAQALALFASPSSKRVPISGASGSLAVAPSGEGVLVVSDLDAAPGGKTYEAWVTTGSRAEPAGVFGGGGTAVIRLSRKVPLGSTVAVTVERRGGVSKPTRAPIMSAQVSNL